MRSRWAGDCGGLRVVGGPEIARDRFLRVCGCATSAQNRDLATSSHVVGVFFHTCDGACFSASAPPPPRAMLHALSKLTVALATPSGVDQRRAGGHVRVRYPPYAQRTCCSASGGCTCSCSCTSRASRARRTCSSSRSRSRTSCRARTPRFSSSTCTAWCTRTRLACTRCCTRCCARRAGTPGSPALPCPLTSDSSRVT